MEARELKCLAEKDKHGFGAGDLFCPQVFDGFDCWRATRAGEEVRQRCPYAEVILLKAKEALEHYATKTCTENGTWWKHPDPKIPFAHWTNYTMCTLLAPVENDDGTYQVNFPKVTFGATIALLESWLPLIKCLSLFGYWISIATVVVAIYILITFRKLQCSRNYLHIHLFVSFIARALMYLTKEYYFVNGVGTPDDFRSDNANHTYITENYSWSCKTIISIQHYFTQCNYFFILMEGIYLNCLMFMNTLSEHRGIKSYYISGWGIPCLFISVWIILKIRYDDMLCWTISKEWLALLIQIPIEATVIINFILFLIICRFLMLKINAMYMNQRRIRYRRLIKSTFTLLLIYSVPYTISILLKYANIQENGPMFVFWVAYDQIFTSIQGVVIAFIYCFMNKDVQTELLRKYNSITYNCKRRRCRTTSNTQQTSLPMYEEPLVLVDPSVRLPQ